MENWSPPFETTGFCHIPGQPDLTPPKLQQPGIRWLGDDGRNVFIEIQGQFAAVAVRKGPLAYTPTLRSECKGFSAASRLRLFKTINRLQFGDAGRCTFATMTWRDELGRPEPKQITQARSWCQRSIEGLAGKHLAGIWRVEWQKRKTGRYRHQLMPHLHVIYFNIPFVPKEAWTRAWGQAIGWPGHVSVKLEAIKELRQCLYYVSKYIAKVGDLSNLDIASYLNRYVSGRKWGTYRKNLLPVADRTEIRVPPGELVESIRRVATEAWAQTPQLADSGFTVFGPAAEKIQKLVDEYCTNGGDVGYTTEVSQRGGTSRQVRSADQQPA
jgi:hypothetical protein